MESELQNVGRKGRIQLGFSSNPVRGSPGDVSHGVSRVSQPPGYGYGVRGTEGAEDRGMGERCFSGWTSEVICVEVVQYVACRIAWKPSVRNDDET